MVMETFSAGRKAACRAPTRLLAEFNPASALLMTDNRYRPTIESALSMQIGRNLAAVSSELLHYLFVQPDIHSCTVVGVAAVAQLLGKRLACGEA